MRLILRILAGMVALGSALLGWAYWSAIADPVVREARIGLDRWPAGAPPVRIVLISDIHVAGPDMHPARLMRIVRQVNALRPDLVLIAGDLVSDKRVATHHYPVGEAIAPLAGLRARLGVFAVIGNHDRWRGPDEARIALAGAGVGLLVNQAVRVGPLVLGGLDDDFTGHARIAPTLAGMRRLPGAWVMLSHSPDPFARLPTGANLLMLAGHTHCGQVRLPFYGPIVSVSYNGPRYECGLVRERDLVLIVTAGLGTSGLPLRLNAPPDLWLVTVGPKRRP